MFQKAETGDRLSGHRMPEMTGLEVLTKIREGGTQPIVLMITAATSERMFAARLRARRRHHCQAFNTAKVIGEMERAFARAKAARKG